MSQKIWELYKFFASSSTLLRCLGGAKSSFDFRRLSFRIIRAAANAILMPSFVFVRELFYLLTFTIEIYDEMFQILIWNLL